MKKIIISLIPIMFLFVSCSGLASITEEQRTKIYIEDHPLSKDNAYAVVFEWIAKNFVSANDVIQMKDEENGTIIVQAVGSYYYDLLRTLTMNYGFTLSIKLKDKKMKLEFITNNIVNSPNLPQSKDIDEIYKNYDSIRSRLLSVMKNYKEDSF